VIDKTNSAARKAVSNRICQRRAGLPWPSSAYIQLAHFDDVSPSRSLGSVGLPKKLNLTHDKSCAFADQKKCTTTRNRDEKTKARFSRLLQQPAWKRSGSILRGKDK